MIGSLTSGTNSSLVAKNLIKNDFILLSIKSSLMGRFWCFKCLKDRIDLPVMIRSFASITTALLMAKNGTKKVSQLFEELQGSNLECKLFVFTPKYITETYFKIPLSRFGLTGLPLVSKRLYPRCL